MVEGVLETDDERKVWGFIRSLNGVPAANASNQTIKVNGKTLTSNRRKADAFVEHYVETSSLKLSKEDCDVKRDLKKRLGSL